jgi:hypothetical protein
MSPRDKFGRRCHRSNGVKFDLILFIFLLILVFITVFFVVTLCWRIVVFHGFGYAVLILRLNSLPSFDFNSILLLIFVIIYPNGAFYILFSFLHILRGGF